MNRQRTTYRRPTRVSFHDMERLFVLPDRQQPPSTRHRVAGWSMHDPWNVAHDHVSSGLGSTWPTAATLLERERKRLRTQQLQQQQPRPTRAPRSAASGGIMVQSRHRNNAIIATARNGIRHRRALQPPPRIIVDTVYL